MYTDQMQVFRVDVQSQAGKEVAEFYGLRLTPSFILFDPQGIELWRSVGPFNEADIQHYLEKQP